jgi:hydroxyacylglutathione hydrolase
MLCVQPVKAFNDNYIWVLANPDTQQAVVVDPGDSEPVRSFLDERGWALAAILATHHHPDHVGGIPALARSGLPVIGPALERIPCRTQGVNDNDQFILPGLDVDVEVLHIPGHTLGHVAFHIPVIDALFCGDTLFGAGCGRLFEGTAEQMHRSLQRLAALPGETQVYCGHEYTLANLAFAQCVEPENRHLADRLAADRARIAQGEPTLPSRMEDEKRTNPFLRVTDANVRAAAEHHAQRSLEDNTAVFAALRHWKDNFRA